MFHPQNNFDNIWESVSKIESTSLVTHTVPSSTITSMETQIASAYGIPLDKVPVSVYYISTGTLHVTTSIDTKGSEVIDMVSTTIT